MQLDLHILSLPETIVSVDEVELTVLPIYIEHKNNVNHIRQLATLPLFSSIRFVFWQDEKHQKILNVPEQLENIVIRFLREFHAKQHSCCDCYAFANVANGIKLHRVSRLLRYWELRPRPTSIGAGNVVFLTSGQMFRHAAIYIGSGLYISVYGAGGDLEVSTLKDMQRDFEANVVHLALPRTDI